MLFLVGIPAIAQLSPPDPLYYRDSQERIHAWTVRTFTDPSRISWLLVDSAIDHWSQSPYQWDHSAESYSFRVASAWGRRIVSNTVQLGFESALREDSRYRRSGDGGFGTRIVFALKHSVLAYKPDGSVEPMYGRMAAGVVAAATSSTWQPQSIGAMSLLGGIAQSALDRTGGNLLTEFEPDLKTFGRKTWHTLHRK